MDLKKTIKKWAYIFDLVDKNIKTKRIDREQVTFPSDISEVDRYYVGVSVIEDNVTIYHDRDLTEEDIIHELIHVAYPKLEEQEVVDFTNQIIKNSIWIY